MRTATRKWQSLILLYDISCIPSARSVARHHAGGRSQPACPAAWLERDGTAHSRPLFPVQSDGEVQPHVPAQDAVGAPAGGRLVHQRAAAKGRGSGRGGGGKIKKEYVTPALMADRSAQKVPPMFRFSLLSGPLRRRSRGDEALTGSQKSEVGIEIRASSRRLPRHGAVIPTGTCAVCYIAV